MHRKSKKKFLNFFPTNTQKDLEKFCQIFGKKSKCWYEFFFHFNTAYIAYYVVLREWKLLSKIFFIKIEKIHILKIFWKRMRWRMRWEDEVEDEVEKYFHLKIQFEMILMKTNTQIWKKLMFLLGPLYHLFCFRSRKIQKLPSPKNRNFFICGSI